MKKTISIFIEEKNLERLKVVSEKQDRSRNYLVNKAIESALDIMEHLPDFLEREMEDQFNKRKEQNHI